MPCEQSSSMNELEFFGRFRGREDGCCLGPVIKFSLGSWQIYQLERIFQGSSRHSDLLWSGFVGDSHAGILFELCAAHWFDLIWFIGLMAFRHRRRDWAIQSGSVLCDLCYAAGWDRKEVANLITSMGVRLT